MMKNKNIEKIKWQERINRYLGNGKHDLVTLEHEAIVVIDDESATVYKHIEEVGYKKDAK